MSTRISKNLSVEVARKLLQSKKEEIESLEKRMIQIVQKVVKDSMDSRIMEAYEKFKGYFNVSNNIVLKNSKGGVFEQTISEYFPCSIETYRIRIEIEDQLFESLVLMEESIESKWVEYKKATKVVSETIFGLRTSLQVQKHFPEAYELLPKETNGSMLPMVNLDQVRALVQ